MNSHSCFLLVSSLSWWPFLPVCASYVEGRIKAGRDPAVIIVHYPWSCAERIPDTLRWYSLYPRANHLDDVFSWCFSSMNSTWDTRNSGSGHYVENLDSIFFRGEKRKKKIQQETLYED